MVGLPFKNCFAACTVLIGCTVSMGYVIRWNWKSACVHRKTAVKWMAAKYSVNMAITLGVNASACFEVLRYDSVKFSDGTSTQVLCISRLAEQCNCMEVSDKQCLLAQAVPQRSSLIFVVIVGPMVLYMALYFNSSVELHLERKHLALQALYLYSGSRICQTPRRLQRSSIYR